MSGYFRKHAIKDRKSELSFGFKKYPIKSCATILGEFAWWCAGAVYMVATTSSIHLFAFEYGVAFGLVRESDKIKVW